jgi:hypothetical protein
MPWTSDDAARHTHKIARVAWTLMTHGFPPSA